MYFNLYCINFLVLFILYKFAARLVWWLGVWCLIPPQLRQSSNPNYGMDVSPPPLLSSLFKIMIAAHWVHLHIWSLKSFWGYSSIKLVFQCSIPRF